MTLERRGAKDVSVWDTSDAKRYAAAKHGPDGAKFLDPHLYAILRQEQIAGSDFLDLGAGAGPWSKHALEQGARTVTAVEINEAMIQRAQDLLSLNGVLPAEVFLVRGDVAHLMFSPNAPQTFDQLASINVGCNLPNGTFQAHFDEAFRVARPGAKFVVTAPNSLHVPFTSSDDPHDIQGEVEDKWKLVVERSVTGAKKVIAGLRSVLRATFILDENGKPVLITEENVDLLNPGDPIIRRIPGLAVDNNFHTAGEYIEAASRAGWKIEKAHMDSFASDEDRDEHNAKVGDSDKLGPEYVDNPAFLVLDLEKSAK